MYVTWHIEHTHTHTHIYMYIYIYIYSFPRSSVSKESVCHAGDPDLIPGLGRSPGEGNGNLLQYGCLENPMDRGAWQAIVCGVARVRHNLATKPSPPYVYIYMTWKVFSSVAQSCPTLCDSTTIYIYIYMTCKVFSSVQFSSVTQSCPTLCDPMNHSTPGLSVHHQLLEFT